MCVVLTCHVKQQPGTPFELVHLGLTMAVTLGVITSCERVHHVSLCNP